MNFETFKKRINDQRKTKTWYVFQDIVDGKFVRLKGFKTWLQIYEVDSIRYGNSGDVSVKQFNLDLEEAFR